MTEDSVIEVEVGMRLVMLAIGGCISRRFCKSGEKLQLALPKNYVWDLGFGGEGEGEFSGKCTGIIPFCLASFRKPQPTLSVNTGITISSVFNVSPVNFSSSLFTRETLIA